MDELDKLADLLVQKMLDHPRMEQTIREVVLRTLTTQDVIRKACAARGFLAASAARGVKVLLTKEGTLHVQGDLGEDLNVALMGCHDDVATHLKQEREIEELAARRFKEDEERQKKVDKQLHEEWLRCGGDDISNGRRKT
jgi:hypothetical protein